MTTLEKGDLGTVGSSLLSAPVESRFESTVAPRPAPARYLRPFAVLGDALGVAAALAVVNASSGPAGAVQMGAVVAASVAIFAAFGLYDLRRLGAASAECRSLIKAVTVCAVVAALVVVPGAPRAWPATLWLSSLTSVGLFRALLRFARSRQPVGVLVIGTNDEGQAIARALARKRWSGYRALGFVEPGVKTFDEFDGLEVVGTIDRLSEVTAQTGAGALVVVASEFAVETTYEIHEDVRRTGLDYWVTSLPSLHAASRMRIDDLDGIPLVAVRRAGRSRWREAGKRGVDIVGSALGLVLGLPLFAAVAVAIKIDDPTGPVFFRQSRVGRAAGRFRVLKFRTMVDSAEEQLEELRRRNEAEGQLFKIREDPRVTTIGRILRRSSLDELPQLWNVLVGDMSLVGPRPALVEETQRYEGDLRRRLDVKPGLTGLWQVNGRQELGWADYVHYDLFYAENWSVGLDLAILARTFPAVIKARGAW